MHVPVLQPLGDPRACGVVASPQVSHKELGLIGEVYNPFTCCNYTLTVRYPKEGTPSEIISGAWCG